MRFKVTRIHQLACAMRATPAPTCQVRELHFPDSGHKRQLRCASLCKEPFGLREKAGPGLPEEADTPGASGKHPGRGSG